MQSNDKKAATQVESAATIFTRSEHGISRQDLDPDALKIMYRLLRHGYKAYMVGGGVRDLLLGKKPKDFDIGTDATPNQIKSLFRNCRIIGRRFKLAHVFFKGGKIIEVSTFRDLSSAVDPIEANIPQFGQNALRDNKYGTAETDAVRRDITINGLFYDLGTFSVIDYVGGMEDLRLGRIRIIGEPALRIAEDPVRMLRAVRHAIRANFVLDPSCEKAILENAHLITKSSPVRVYEEIRKDLCSGHGCGILKFNRDLGLFDDLWPELAAKPDSILTGHDKLSDALKELDRLILSGQTLSPTLILSVIAFFIIRNQNPEANHQDLAQNRDLLADYVSDCFTQLAVPKKERMRIEDLLRLFFKITTTEPKRISSTSLLKNPALPELPWFIKALGQDSPEMPWSKILEDLQAKLIHGSERDKTLIRHPQRRGPRQPRHRGGVGRRRRFNRQ